MTYDIVALGESLIDFVGKQQPGAASITLEGNPGGAPANVLASAAKLGRKTAFIGKLGQDSFGEFLAHSMQGAGIDTSGVLFSEQSPTTLAMVTLSETGDRSFRFYRNQTADVMLEAAEVKAELVENTRVFHFGSLSMTDEPARSATMDAKRRAKAAGAAISYDPNLRALLWPSLDEARARMLEGMVGADYVKVSEEELEFLTGLTDADAAMDELVTKYSPRLLVVTRGAKGCFVRIGARSFAAKTFDTLCVDTTGSGDAFWGATLSYLLDADKDVGDFSDEQVAELMDYANAAGSLAATKYGAIPAMPSEEEIRTCMRTMPRCEA